MSEKVEGTEDDEVAGAGNDFFFTFLSAIFFFVVTSKFHENTSPAAVLDTRDPFDVIPEPVAHVLWYVLLLATIFFLVRGIRRSIDAARAAQ